MSRRENNLRRMKEAKRWRRETHATVSQAATGQTLGTMLSCRNDGGRLVESNYWESENAQRGLFLVSLNAGTFRLLVPKSQEGQVAEIRTGRHAVVTLGCHRDDGKVAYELMFEDGSDAPYALWLSPRQIDRAFGIDDAASKPRELVVYTRGCVEAARMPVFFRQAETLPCLKPWAGDSAEGERRATDEGVGRRTDAAPVGPPIDFESLIRGFIANPDVRSLQHGLAAQYRRRFGHAAKGQLWQPCEAEGCSEEPVCMNCLRCQARHCRCFEPDAEGV